MCDYMWLLNYHKGLWMSEAFQQMAMINSALEKTLKRLKDR